MAKKKRYILTAGQMVEDGNGDWVRYTPRKTKEADARIPSLVAYFAGKFHSQCGFAPTINWGSWGKVFKRHLKDCDQETIEVVIDKFFAYPKRTKFSIYDFDRCFDNTFFWAKKEQSRVG
jgi:hypothetical protein